MNNTLNAVESLITLVKNSPEKVEFPSVMSVIEESYQYTPCEFRNGEIQNAKGTNEGSCKIFAFAKLNALNEKETLALFGDYYRVDVLQNPSGVDHQNIRTFMVSGWPGIHFDSQALIAK